MDDLIKLVSEKAGISADQAKTAIETAMGYLKDKLPAGVSEHVEGFLSGKEMPGGLAGMAKGIKDKLGL